MRYSMLTVCCPRDREKMILQARSVARYVPVELVDDVQVVLNGPGYADFGWLGLLREAYGDHAVSFSLAEKLLDPTDAGVDGWWTQQALKLQAAELVWHERYVILDAKNHFVAPLTLDLLENEAKLPRTGCHDYRGHNMGGFTEASLRFFGIDPARHMGLFLQTVTPFVAYRKLALHTCREVGARWVASGNNLVGLARIFASARVTEFMTYGAAAVASGHRIEELYDPYQPGCGTLWASEVSRLEEYLARARFTFGVHSEAWKLLTYRQKERIAAFWLERGLVRDFNEGMAMLRACGAAAEP